MSIHDNQESLAPAAGGEDDDGVREYHPVVMWGKDADFDMYDFRATPEEEIIEEPEEEADDPKASSAPGSALAAIYETVRTPDLPQTVENPASVERAPLTDRTSESGSSTSSKTPEPKHGSSEPPA